MPARACKFERTSCLRKTKRNIIGNVRNNVAIPPNGHRIGAPGKSIWNSHGAMRTTLVRYKDFSRGAGPRELTRGRTPDRKRVGEGKSRSVSEDLVGRRIIKKKK